MSIDGNWKITIKGPTGPMSTKLVLSTADGTLSGTQSGQGETSTIVDAKFDGKTIYWVNNTTKPMKLKVEFTGEVNGDQMSGKVKTGFMGTFPFTGTKEPG
jgi:hypothetical protein